LKSFNLREVYPGAKNEKVFPVVVVHSSYSHNQMHQFVYWFRVGDNQRMMMEEFPLGEILVKNERLLDEL
jgi:hypothetical protein